MPDSPDRPLVDQRRLLIVGPFSSADLEPIRRQLDDECARWGVPPRTRSVLALVATELVANIVVHCGGDGRLQVALYRGRLVCQAFDRGPGIPRSHRAGWRPPSPSAPSGRGLWLARVFSDRFAVDSSPLGTTVTAVIEVRPPGPPDDPLDETMDAYDDR
ncbi:anti-sigma regulatory factor (Ser/Thr protein kinase) [Hamadaea flava]|uniref:ATP-binding protein n=1 Tax=Hamadaea flava TaxID=1742688 RepID=A0ABV8LNL2_9ACTN|nr:ATP-binding protein [Hamadaea flava]MCP2329703.1 anti-sigma regulatory factor (Ser/Thr protein kinase) [Hamadaea flava]